jgi:RNA polymerase sigma factor (sigma-70 family)
MKRFLTQYHSKLQHFFDKYSKSAWDAEELTQEVFCKMLKRNDLPEEQYPDSHLYTIAWSVLRDRARRDRVRLRDMHINYDEAAPAVTGISPEQIVDGEEQYNLFLTTLNELPAKTRDVFLLNRYEGLTYTQIADHYGLSVSSVEKHMMKALSRIKQALTQQ